MNIRIILLLMFFPICTYSCSSSEEPTPNVSQKEYTIKLNIGGEYVNVTEEPLSKSQTSPKKYVGINILYRPTGNSTSGYNNYAYGVFDNTENISVTLPGDYEYKFECSSVTEADDIFSSSILAEPFTIYNSYSAVSINRFVVDSSHYLCDLKSGKTLIATNSDNVELRTYPRMDRYYGELDNFSPVKSQSATIKLKRAVFGVKILLEDGVPDGSLEWEQKGAVSINQALNFTPGTASGSNRQEYSHIYTFKSVYDAWKNDNQTETFTIKFTWTRSSNFKQTFEKEITVKRNVMSVLNVSLKSTEHKAGIGIDEETTDMTTEEIPVEIES